MDLNRFKEQSIELAQQDETLNSLIDEIRIEEISTNPIFLPTRKIIEDIINLQNKIFNENKNIGLPKRSTKIILDKSLSNKDFSRVLALLNLLDKDEQALFDLRNELVNRLSIMLGLDIDFESLTDSEKTIVIREIIR